MIDNQARSIPHHLVLENRRRLSISGVQDVESFDENGIVCATVKGTVVVKGSELHVDRLNLDGGELSVEGNVDSVEYVDSARDTGGGFFARLFR